MVYLKGVCRWNTSTIQYFFSCDDVLTSFWKLIPRMGKQVLQMQDWFLTLLILLIPSLFVYSTLMPSTDSKEALLKHISSIEYFISGRIRCALWMIRHEHHFIIFQMILFFKFMSQNSVKWVNDVNVGFTQPSSPFLLILSFLKLYSI